MIGTYLLHYKILKKLGEGGQGEVYQAEDTRLRRTVAIKILPPELVADEKSRKRFLREAQLASALDHPNICTVYEINEDKNLHFIVMQYLEGKRLKQMVRGRPLELESVLSIAIQLADALAAAHERGVIHRDVKATNVIVNDRGQAKILDFGLAKATTTDIGDQSVMELTQAGVPFGTAGYMSPEQARGGTIDQRSDVFSLGVLIYEMVTGKLPFQGKSSVEIMHAVMHEAAPPLAQTNPNLPDRLQVILDKAMAKGASGRYQHMRDFQVDLKQLMRNVQSQSGGMVDESIMPPIAPRHEKPGWLKNGMVGRLLNRLMSPGDQPPPRPSSSRERDSQATGSRQESPRTDPAATLSPGPSPREKDSLEPSQEQRQARSLRDSMPSTWKNNEKRAIAILPFKNLSGDPESDFYSFSLADSLITELAALKSLVVRPSSFIAKFQGREIDAQKVGAELKVDAVLISGYLKAGNRFRVTPQLIDINTGEILWSDKIDLDAADIMTLQDTISRKIVDELRVRITETEQVRIATPATNNSEAYEYYLRGRNQLNRFMQTMMKDDFSSAIGMFENALRLDPNFALAHSGIGLCYVQYVLKGIGGSVHFERAEGRFREAMKLDDSLIEPQSNMVYIHLLKNEKTEARAQVKRVLSVAPNDANVHSIAGYLYRWDGLYKQALQQYDTCIKLNPTDLVPAAYNRARILVYQGRYEDALNELESALFYEPDHPFTLMVLGQVQYYQGQWEEASTTLKNVLDRNPDLHAFRPIYGLCHVATGHPEKALAIINDAVRDTASADGDAAYWLATVYAALKRESEALQWLRKAITLGNENYPWFCNNPDWKDFQDNPKFKEILEPLRVQWLDLCRQYGNP